MSVCQAPIKLFQIDVIIQTKRNIATAELKNPSKLSNESLRTYPNKNITIIVAIKNILLLYYINIIAKNCDMSSVKCFWQQLFRIYP